MNMTGMQKLRLAQAALGPLVEFFRRWVSPFEGAALGQVRTPADDERAANEWARERMYERRVAAMKREGWV